uniref:Uncharacterized protein n=1 Tax=viral metagenome TaxID=1070528 RepID=A0A6C0ETH1_9ZZZZ
MGRYYFGQISGKFWFGFQNSDDASYFGVNYKHVKNFYSCSCEIEDTDNLAKEIYCTDCYASFEEHKQAMIDEDVELYDDDDSDSTWYTSDSEITYHFDASHIGMVEKKIKICEDLIGDYVNDSSYKIIDDGDEITYDYTTPSNMIGTDIELIARLCLGKQILYCLRKNGECFFTAEL